ENDVFWTAGNGASGYVAKWPISAGYCSQGPTVLANGLTSPVGLAVDDINVYFSTTGGGVVSSVPRSASIDAGTVPTVLASGRANPFAIAVDASSVYFTVRGSGANDGSVVRVDKQTKKTFTIADQQALPAGIAVDGAFVYWANEEGGTVMR